MRRVRCVSPQGGAPHGIRADNEEPAPPGYQGALKLPPNEGGWVSNAVLGTVAVGDEVDAPEPPEFIADGFHFVDAAAGAGDVCQAPGPGCWCGGAHHIPAPVPQLRTGNQSSSSVPAVQPAVSLADLLGKENI